jgi:HPt (histidine-containing phosphotransfer) domain-containing protein
MNDCITKPFTPEDLLRTLVKHSGSVSPAVISESSTRGVATVHIDLSHLERISNGNPVFVKEMVTLFKESMPASIQEMKSLKKQKEWEKLAKAMHKIKPTMMMLGLGDFRNEASELEDLLIHDEPQDLDQRILQFEEKLDALLVSLKSIPD